MKTMRHEGLWLNSGKIGVLYSIALLALYCSIGWADGNFSYLGATGIPGSAFPKPERPVASIISPIWHSEAERDAANEPAQIIALLGLKPGLIIADIGAGSGYYAVRLSPIAGPNGQIIAQDVTPRYLKFLEAKVRASRLSNITLALGDGDDPRLPGNSVDIALLVHMYHEIEQPYAFLYNLAPALKAKGRVAIVDATRPTQEHGTPPSLLRCELHAVGYREEGFFPLKGSEAYLAIFAPPSERPAPGSIQPCRG